MKVNSRNIELFKNLSEFDINEIYFDFHNDFNCINIKFENKSLILSFQDIVNDFLVLLCFENTVLTTYNSDFFLFSNFLTLDNLYRGKCQVNEKLTEFENEKGYFYLEFYEGQKAEFWCENLIVKKLLK